MIVTEFRLTRFRSRSRSRLWCRILRTIVWMDGLLRVLNLNLKPNLKLMLLMMLMLIPVLPGIVAAAPNDRWIGMADLVFQHYTQDQGLPQPIVTAISEDAEGFLWIGTQGGLARWDGYRFRTYVANLKTPGSLVDNTINVLHLDPSGRLWIGTSNGGLVRYNGQTDRFEKVTGLSSTNILSVADDGSDGLWVGTDLGLDHYHPKSGAVQSLHHNDADPGSLPDDQVYAMVHDRKGILWVGTKTSLARFDTDTGKFAVVPLVAGTVEVNNIRSILEDHLGRLWIGTNHNGAFVLDNAGPVPSAAHQVEESDGAKSSFSTDNIVAIAESERGSIWMGTYDEGIIEINPDTGQSRHIRHDLKIASSLMHDQIWALHVDHSGTMMVGDTSGLDRLTNADGAILSLFGDSGRDNGVASSDVISLFETPTGLIWLGYTGNGLDVITPTGKRVNALRPDRNHPDTTLPIGPIAAFASDDKSMFIGTYSGLFRSDLNGNGLTRVPVPNRHNVTVHALIYDQGLLWIGGRYDGLDVISANGAALPPVTHFDSQQLTDQRINVIMRGLNNDVWVGTGNGLNRIDLKTCAVEKIEFDPDNANGLAAGYISSLLIDRQGHLWVGLFGGGINILTGRDKQGRPVFKKLTTDDGLPNNNVDSLMADNAGKIWISSDDGLGVVDPETMAVRAFHRADGVGIMTYWVNAKAKTSAGEILFGGSSGLTVIRPGLVRDWTYMPPIVITDAQVGGKTVPLTALQHSTQPIVVAPDENNISFEFSALDYTAPKRNLYEYRLEGFDKNWIATDYTRRLANYNNLPPGKYTLRIRGTNRTGTWVEKSLDIPIKVVAAWYQTWLFRVGVTLLMVMVVVLVVRARTDYLHKAKLELEELVALRTRELSRSAEQLRQSKLQLEEIAFLDALTGLPNRRLFTERFENFKASATRNGSKFALLLIDLDKFKYINDTYGHDAGDAVLIATAQRLTQSVRSVDVVARLGGDEFAVLLDGSEPLVSIRTVCDRMMNLCNDPIVFGSHQFIVSMSIGAAVFGEHGNFQADLYKSADMALYEAKGSGRNTWRCYGSANDDSTTGSSTNDGGTT